MMEHRLKIGERCYEVTVGAGKDAGAQDVVVDGARHEVVVRGIRDGVHSVTVDGRPALLHVARCPEGTWIGFAGRTRLVRDAEAEERRSARRGGGIGGGTVTPTFPSVVVSVLVAVGDQVRKAQALVVISAMKMESRLVAPHAGRVRAIHAAVGASVKPGDELVEIEPPPGEGGDE